MFLNKGKFEMKEFDQMRQALRSNDRNADHADAEKTERAASADDGLATAGTSNISVTSAALTRPAPAEAAVAHPDKCSSVVSVGSTWDGVLKIDGSVRIDGTLSGEVEARGTVHVSKGAEVDAKVRAAFLVVAGVFHGHAFCGERLEILPTGRVTGELMTKSLVVHEGSFLEGELRMSDEQLLAAAAPVAIPSSANGVAKGTNGAANGSARPLAKAASLVAVPPASAS
jgi:cytoskeletal protein CcmA (bactofilin family)